MFRLILLFFIVCFSFSVEAQQNRKNGQWLIGGDLGYSGGSNSSYFGISPEVSYLNENGFEMGASIGYSRITFEEIKRNIYSIGPLVSYNIGESFFARTRYQYLMGTTTGAADNTSINESGLWIGGGYIDRQGGNGVLRIGAMYNVLYNGNSRVYSSPILPFASFSFAL